MKTETVKEKFIGVSFGCDEWPIIHTSIPLREKENAKEYLEKFKPEAPFDKFTNVVKISFWGE